MYLVGFLFFTKMVTFTKNKQTNKITFYQNGKVVYPISINGNIAEFKNQLILF